MTIKGEEQYLCSTSHKTWKQGETAWLALSSSNKMNQAALQIITQYVTVQNLDLKMKQCAICLVHVLESLVAFQPHGDKNTQGISFNYIKVYKKQINYLYRTAIFYSLYYYSVTILKSLFTQVIIKAFFSIQLGFQISGYDFKVYYYYSAQSIYKAFI